VMLKTSLMTVMSFKSNDAPVTLPMEECPYLIPPYFDVDTC
jgi:hypothetical protein